MTFLYAWSGGLFVEEKMNSTRYHYFVFTFWKVWDLSPEGFSSSTLTLICNQLFRFSQSYISDTHAFHRNGKSWLFFANNTNASQGPMFYQQLEKKKVFCILECL